MELRKYGPPLSYEGELLNNVRHGYGVSTFATGEVYIGSHYEDDLSGVGALACPNGDFYFGQFVKGACDGHGVLCAGGQVIRGFWARGALQTLIPDEVPEELRTLNSRAFLDLLGVLQRQGTPAGPLGQIGKVKSLEEPDRLGATLLVACGPAFVERFAIKRFFAQFLMFLFPIAAIPHFSRCYYGRASLAQEREYVVSGAAIRKPPALPKNSIYVVIFALSCAVVSLVIGCIYFGDFGSVAIVDLVSPFVGWVVFAAMLSGYHSLRRTPHPMERLDRHLIPRLASFCASNVDSYSPVCVYTWDVEGRTLVPNNHYMYRWGMYSLPIAALVALASPFARIANEQSMFGSTVEEKVVASFAFISLFLFTFCVAFMCFKVTDIQRQVLGQLRVLSSMAYVGGSSVLRPMTLRNVFFNFDEEVDLRSYDTGFTGWCMARSFLIYCSVCSNHRARGAVLTVLTILGLAVSIAGIVDVLAFQRFDYCTYANAHAVGLAVLVLFSAMALRLQYLAVSTRREQKSHLYLIDLACSLSRTLRHKNATEFEVCRDMVRRYDTLPELMFTEVRPWMMFIFFLVCCGGYASFIYAVVQAPRC